MSNSNRFSERIQNHFKIHPLELATVNGLDHENQIIRPCVYEIIWVKSGSGLVATDLKEYEINNKIVYCLSPGQLRNLRFETTMDGYYISISADFFHAAEAEFNFSFLSGGKEPVKGPILIQMDEDIQNDVEEILLKMKKEFNNYLSLRLEILKGLFKIFLLYLSRKFVVKEFPGRNKRDADLVRRFTGLLSRHVATKKMVADYAGELSVTPSYLNQVVKKVSGFTASHHIQQYVVLEAKKQAIHSNRSMKEIAYDLGFDDIAHFSKFFKNNSGVNFTNYKKETCYRQQY